MNARYHPRTLEPALCRAVAEFPAVVLTGPRQSGKTTLLRHCLGATHRYVSLEPPDVRAAAGADPRGFLDLWPAPVIFDEIQYAPALLPYLKENIDAERGTAGRFVLSGSQNLLLLEQVTETLAGRAAILQLMPLSNHERSGRAAALPVWARPTAVPDWPLRPPADFWRDAQRGGYPEVALDVGRDAALWLGSFVQTYLERDVRSLRQVGDLTQFQLFLRTLASRSGQLLNLTDLGRDLGLVTNTVKAWLSVLEATFQVIVLRPYHANIGKRLVKTPRIYFTDTGLLCHLAGIPNADLARSGPLAGAIAETAVVVEVAKAFWHRGGQPRLGFWRTATGDEVDLLVETPTGLLPIEVKAAATPGAQMARGIHRFREQVANVRPEGYVVHPGDTLLPLGQGVLALPFDAL